MSEIILPTEFIQRIKAKPGMTFLLEIQPNHDHRDCKNCSGMGEIFVFHAEVGPMRNVPPPRRGKVVHSMTDPVYGYVWYSGETHSLPCPVCKGNGKASVQLPATLEEPAYKDHTV